MAEIICGRNPVVEALKAPLRIDKILLAEKIRGEKITEILSLARRSNIPVETVPQKRIIELGGTHAQGILAFVKMKSSVTFEQILSKGKEQLAEPPFVVLLDSVQDPHNLGAILRASDGAGVHGVILPKRRSAGLTTSVVKASAGAAAHVPTVVVSNLNYAIDKLRSEKVWIVGADQNADQIYTEVDLSGALGVVVGGEGRGLHRLVKQNCDFLVRIPMYGRVSSLNASVATALLLFEARRQRRNKLL